MKNVSKITKHRSSPYVQRQDVEFPNGVRNVPKGLLIQDKIARKVS